VNGFNVKVRCKKRKPLNKVFSQITFFSFLGITNTIFLLAFCRNTNNFLIDKT
jgi:hypothetical protein